MHDELDVRIVRALRAEADSLSVTVTPEQIEERLARSSGMPWLAPAFVAVGVVALMLTVALGVAEPRGLIGSDPTEQPQASDLQVWPDEPLPPPYDWDGVREALRPRGLVLERPTASEAARAIVDRDELLAAAEQHLADEPRATIVGVHLGVVTRQQDGRGPQLTRELVYVVETTGHATGNCFDLWSATGEGSILGACFYPNRTQPPPDDEACAVTQPDPSFVPPPPYPSSPPDGRSVWFGTSQLWTMLEPDGEVWEGSEESPLSLMIKTFWWSSDWAGMREEQEPAITVVGTRLDGPGTFTTDHATNAAADSLGGEAMLVGIEFPTAGCWQLTAEYRDAVLSYVVWIQDE